MKCDPFQLKRPTLLSTRTHAYMTTTPKLEWSIIRLKDDNNWWVESLSDEKRWDVDGLGIIDPSQIGHSIDLCEPLRDYGFDPDILDDAFFKFGIDGEIEEGCIKLVRIKESFFESEEPLFALPDILDEEKGPYADFIEQITKSRVKMLNDLIDFEQPLTIEDLQDEIREQQKLGYYEEDDIHFFTQITTILEYVPKGYGLDFEEESTPAQNGDESLSEIPDLVEEKIEEDETMKWVDEDAVADADDFQSDEDNDITDFEDEESIEASTDDN